MTHAGGRPTEYSQEILDKAKDYRDNLPEDEVVHSIEGLALHINLNRSTIYDWRSQEGKVEFSNIVEAILEKQGKTLVNKGLSGVFNSSISKVMLTKHGYREGQDITTNERDITFAPGIVEKRADDILSNGQRETKD